MNALRLAPGLAAAACLFCLAPPPATAQSCAAEGSLPRVCSIQVLGGAPGEPLGELDLGRAIVVPMSGELDLVIRGFDQWGALFPEDRLSAGHRLDYDCRGLLEMEPTQEPFRLRLRGGERQGSCRGSLWIPGNLNLEWPVVLEVAGRARVGYNRTEAEYVTTRLYDALFQRVPDAGGLVTWSDLIARGDLAGAVRGLAASAEFRALQARESPSRLLDQVYLGLLGRPVDASGARAFLPMAEAGRWDTILWELLRSDEFESRLASGLR